jgi:hypothetical protein
LGNRFRGGKYGSPRITADLRDAGWRVSHGAKVSRDTISRITDQ